MPQASNSNSKTTLEFDLLGEKLQVTASEDPEIVNEVAALVKLRLQESRRRLSQKNAQPARQNVLLLALLDLAEEYVKSKRRTLVHRSKIGSKLVEIRAMLDRAEGRA
jgi:hypothetical protein